MTFSYENHSLYCMLKPLLYNIYITNIPLHLDDFSLILYVKEFIKFSLMLLLLCFIIYEKC